jgi:hypothetical protein
MYPPSVLAIEGRALMRIGRPIPPLTITDEERKALERWARRPTTAQALAQRARVILELRYPLRFDVGAGGGPHGGRTVSVAALRQDAPQPARGVLCRQASEQSVKHR